MVSTPAWRHVVELEADGAKEGARDRVREFNPRGGSRRCESRQLQHPTSHCVRLSTARKFQVDEAALTLHICTGQRGIFSAHQEMLEYQLRNVQTGPERKRLNIDAGGV